MILMTAVIYSSNWDLILWWQDEDSSIYHQCFLKVLWMLQCCDGVAMRWGVGGRTERCCCQQNRAWIDVGYERRKTRACVGLREQACADIQICMNPHPHTHTQRRSTSPKSCRDKQGEIQADWKAKTTCDSWFWPIHYFLITKPQCWPRYLFPLIIEIRSVEHHVFFIGSCGFFFMMEDTRIYVQRGK